MRATAFPALLSIFLLAVGCGGRAGDLSGTVSYRGKPLVCGGVTALGPDGLHRTGTIQEDGTYTLRDVQPGAGVKLVVFSNDPKGVLLKKQPTPQAGKDKRQARPGLSAEEKARLERLSAKWQPIPARYRQFDTTDLAIAVKPGDNAVTLELKD